MGIENSVYVGIYLKIPVNDTAVEVTEYYHPVTGKKMKSKFCPNTGVPGYAQIKETNEKNYPWPEIDELLKDDEVFPEDDDMTFWCPQYGPWGDKHSVFLLNSESKYKEDFDSDDQVCIDLTETKDYKSLIDEFKKEYKPWLDIYEREYGEVYIGYGVISYAN
jgi:hypothetical protein